MTELLKSVVVDLDGDGVVDHQKTLENLLKEKKSAYVLIGERPGDLPSCTDVNNFVALIKDEGIAEEEKVARLLDAWNVLVKKDNKTVETRIIVLPRFVDAKIAMPLFSQIRLDLLGAVGGKPHPVIIVGDYITYRQMSQETGDCSSLEKELTHIYLLDRYAAPDKMIQWLSFTTCSLISYHHIFYHCRANSRTRQKL